MDAHQQAMLAQARQLAEQGKHVDAARLMARAGQVKEASQWLADQGLLVDAAQLLLGALGLPFEQFSELPPEHRGAARLAASWYGQAQRFQMATAIYLGLGETQSAKRCYEACLELLQQQPTYAPEYRILAASAIECAYRLREIDFELDYALQDMIETGPLTLEEAQSFTLLAELYEQHEQLENAQELLERTVKRFPQFAQAQQKLSSIKLVRKGVETDYERVLNEEREFRGDAMPGVDLSLSFDDLPGLPDLPPLPPLPSSSASGYPPQTDASRYPGGSSSGWPVAQRTHPSEPSYRTPPQGVPPHRGGHPHEQRVSRASQSMPDGASFLAEQRSQQRTTSSLHPPQQQPPSHLRSSRPLPGPPRPSQSLPHPQHRHPGQPPPAHSFQSSPSQPLPHPHTRQSQPLPHPQHRHPSQPLPHPQHPSQQALHAASRSGALETPQPRSPERANTHKTDPSLPGVPSSDGSLWPEMQIKRTFGGLPEPPAHISSQLQAQASLHAPAHLPSGAPAAQYPPPRAPSGALDRQSRPLMPPSGVYRSSMPNTHPSQQHPQQQHPQHPQQQHPQHPQQQQQGHPQQHPHPQHPQHPHPQHPHPQHSHPQHSHPQQHPQQPHSHPHPHPHPHPQQSAHQLPFAPSVGPQPGFDDVPPTDPGRSLPVPPERLAPGTVFASRYKLGDCIGRGGMAVVFRAFDILLQEEVALKVFSPFGADETSLQRFKQELRLSRRLSHPHITKLFDIGHDMGYFYISMELLLGQNLERCIRDPALLFHHRLRFMIQASEGLAYAHEHGVIHRDVKSSNIFITNQGQAKLLDFGLAKVHKAPSLTDNRTILGTALYISPEQIRDFRTITPIADLYSLGIVAYELFTGRLPFVHDEIIPVLMMQIEQPPPPPRAFNPQIPPPLEALILRLLHKDPAHRYADGKQLAAHLKRILASLR